MTKKTGICLLTGALLAVSQAAKAGPAHKPLVLSGFDANKAACIAIYDRKADQYLIHGLEQCQEALSPCSTFKIPNALIGLEAGVLSGPDDQKAWDGTQHSRQVNNQDHDLASAIKNSVVWYFQDVAMDIGPERMQEALNEMDYGNHDISGGQDRFWLSSSLEITALEQIRFMDKLDRHALPASPAKQETVKSLMLQNERLPEDFTGAVYGKTGSCVGPETDHGWFTGFYHRDDQQYVFAVNVKGKKEWGWQAREIALNVLNNLP